MRIPKPLTIALLTSLLFSGGALWLNSSAVATSTQVFRIDSSAEFEAGEFEATQANSVGHIEAGINVRRLGLPEVQLASALIRDGRGDLIVGTGNEGRIFRVRNGNTELFAETEQLLVSSLSRGPDGLIFAGTLPEGRIFKIAQDGTLDELARPEGVEHIWDLRWDERTQRLYAATGPHGQIFAIAPNGETEIYFDSEDPHIMSLALGPEGALFAGTEGNALLYRITAPGQAEVVHDFPGDEVTDITLGPGFIAAAVNEFPRPVRPTTKRTPALSTRRRPQPGKGRLWRLENDRSELVFSRDDGHFPVINAGADGTVYVGSATDGRIYRVNADRSFSTWVDVDERQVLGLTTDSPRPAFVTGDAGAIYEVTGEPSSARYWVSAPLDGAFQSRWGELTWRAEGRLRLQTRSGNTAEPDATWTDWSNAIETPGPVRSPTARFIQIRVDLSQDPEAVLRAVELYYLPLNQRAHVHSITVQTHTKSSPSSSSGKAGTSATSKRRQARAKAKLHDASSRYKIRWKVTNPDRDRMRYRLRYRGDGQERYRDMLSEDTVLTETEYLWQTESIPDGWYRVEIEASDELDNPAARILRDRDESEPFLIDNHAPRIESARVVRGHVVGHAVDDASPIARLEVAINGERWVPIAPEDGILDSRRESFRFPVEVSGDAPHIIAIRALDQAGNRVSYELEIPSNIPNQSQPRRARPRFRW